MMWRCPRCGQLHACNPHKCADCEYSILEPDHTSDASDISPPTSVSDAIRDTVSDAKDVRYDELDPLTDAIDPEALDSLVREETRYGQIQFRYAGFDVAVHPSGAIELDRIDDE